jgi:hypothetical protein
MIALQALTDWVSGQRDSELLSSAENVLWLALSPMNFAYRNPVEMKFVFLGEQRGIENNSFPEKQIRELAD